MAETVAEAASGSGMAVAELGPAPWDRSDGRSRGRSHF